MYSNLCGYRTWDLLMKAVNSTPPSECDENLSAEIVETRKAYYVQTLIGVFGMNPDFAEYVIDHANPSSTAVPKRFSIKRDEVYEPEGDSRLNLKEMFRAAGLGSERDINRVMNEFAETVLGDDMPEGGFENFAERLRISRPVDPSHWYNLLATMKWTIDESSYNEEYVYGEDSFTLVDRRGVDIPVYLTSLVRTPLDSTDAMANEVLKVCQEHCESEIGSDRCILFWGSPVMKEINGRWFAHFGMYLANDKWSEFLMNETTTLEDVFDQKHDDIDNPNIQYEDINRRLAMGFMCMINNIPEGENAPYSEVGTMSGWNYILF